MAFNARMAIAASGAAVVAALAMLAGAGPAAANPTFANDTGYACSQCHMPAQEQSGRAGLNPFGQAFRGCSYKVACAIQRTSAAPIAPVQVTTETADGIAVFNNHCANQKRWVGVRAGKNNAKRDVLLILEPNQSIQVGVSQGSTYSATCGSPPNDSDPFHWITLRDVVR